jgi:hypothetical protein
MFIVGAIIIGVICGLICQAISSNRDMEGGFLWGFFLGIIGIIIVAVRPRDPRDNQKDVSRIFYCNHCKKTYSCESQGSCPECENMLIPTEFLLSEWNNFSQEKKEELKLLFAEGKQLLTHEKANQTAEAAKPDIYAEITQLKKLFDDGIITQEEFDTKKKQLLGL